jgi:Flp pilus assembly protein TadD
MLGEYHWDEALMHLRRGKHLERANRVEEAVQEYRQALTHNPHLAEAHGALGSYYHRQGLLTKAADSFATLVSLADDFRSNRSLASVLIDLGRYDEALVALRRCLALAPDNLSAHYECAVVHYQRGEYREALALLDRALHRTPQQWAAYHLLGSCRLRLGAFEAARAAFDAALRLAERPDEHHQTSERLAALDRYREIETPAGVKDRLYTELGAACIGSAQDDGIHFTEWQDYYFTYPDIATTIRRLAAIATACDWRLSCVAALDRTALPLAQALAAVLAAPLRSAEQLRPGERALTILAVGREAELLSLGVERTQGAAVTFCLGLNWLRHSDQIPDITGVVARGACSVPWEPELRRLRAEGAAPQRIMTCLERAAAQIAAALAETPADHNLGQQVAYYQSYARLRFTR